MNGETERFLLGGGSILMSKEKRELLLRTRIPGAVSEDTLYKMVIFSKSYPIPLGSIKDENFIRAFIPEFSEIRKALFVRNVSQELINNAAEHAFQNFEGNWGYRIPAGFLDGEIKQVLRAILQYSVNKAVIIRGGKLKEKFNLKTPPSTRPSILKGRIIRVGVPYKVLHPEHFAPVPDPISSQVIASMVGFPDENTPRDLTPNQLKTVEDNIDVVNTLFGSDLNLKTFLDIKH
jgi:hypothetical protein